MLCCTRRWAFLIYSGYCKAIGYVGVCGGGGGGGGGVSSGCSLTAGANEYVSMEDLLQHACRLSNPMHIPKGLRRVDTPLEWREWDRGLALHPDQ